MLTASERRGALIVVILLVIGAGFDWWRARPGGEVALFEPAVPAAPDPGGGIGWGREDSLQGRHEAANHERLIDLNQASAGELESLPGIGPVLAARVIAYRDTLGGFSRVEDLLAVRGIGPRLFERLKSRVTISSRR